MKQSNLTTKISASSEIPAIINNVIWLQRDAVGPALLNELYSELVHSNPNYHAMQRMAEKNPEKFRYTKMPPTTISSIIETETSILVPRGFKQTLIQITQNHGQTIKFHDKTILFPRDTGMRIADTLVLKDYQRKGLASLILNRDGIIVAPCGGGKTVMGVAAICALAQPTLVLVHTTDLLQQWQRELAEKAIIPGGVGQWGAGQKNARYVTLATIQTLVRMPSEELREFVDQFGCVLLDEAHHCPADTFMAVINVCKAAYRLGLTATPKRRDGLEFLMTDVLGPVHYQIEDLDLQAEGRSQNCDVQRIYTSFFTIFTADQWTKLVSEMVNDPTRNQLIVDTVVKSWEDGLFPLVLSDRVNHCTTLLGELKRRGMNAQLLTGSVPKNIREKVIQWSREGLVDAIVATKVADEGLDIENLSAIHLTTPTSNEPKLQQRIGRIRRPMPDKRSVVYDYVDTRVASCARMAKQRTRLFRRWGFNMD